MLADPQNWTVLLVAEVEEEVECVLRADGMIGSVQECCVREQLLPARYPKRDVAPDCGAPDRVVPGYDVVPPIRTTVLRIRIEQSFLVKR